MERLIYTDASGAEQGYLKDFSLDLETGSEDDFTLTIPLADYHKITAGGFVIPEKAPELGGVITAVTVNTAEQKAEFTGATWLGCLKTVAFNRSAARATIKALVDAAIGTFDIFINVAQSVAINYAPPTDRLTSYDVLHDFCKKNGYKITVKYESAVTVENTTYYNRIAIDLVQPVNYSSNEYNAAIVNMQISKNERPVNHVVALNGSNEPSLPVIAHRYMRRDGEIDDGTADERYYYLGREMTTRVIVTQAENAVAEMVQILREENSKTKSVVITVGEIEADAGDLVSGYDPVSGLSAVTTIKSKNLKMTQSSFSVTFET